MRTLVLIQMLLIVLAGFIDDEPASAAAPSCEQASR